MLAIWPIQVAIVFGVAANGLGAFLAWALLPRTEPEPAPGAVESAGAGGGAEIAAEP
jgi:hypothetical protein